MRAHQPDGRTRAPGQRTGPDRQPPARGPGQAAAATLPTRARGVFHLDAAELAQLNRLAGNAAVAALVDSAGRRPDRVSPAPGDGPVLQRIPLSPADKLQIKNLKKAERKVATKRIEKFDATEGAVWLFLTAFPASSKVPGDDQKQFLRDLYGKLGQGEELDQLREFRERLDQKWGDALRGQAANKPGRDYPSSRPGGITAPAPSLAEIREGRGRLQAPPSSGALDLGPGPRQGQRQARRAPSAAWSGFPQDVQSELLGMWRTWQKGEVDAASFYDHFYKKSNVKEKMEQPNRGQYVGALKAQGLLGTTSEADAGSSRSGYPLSQPHKGGVACRGSGSTSTPTPDTSWTCTSSSRARSTRCRACCGSSSPTTRRP